VAVSVGVEDAATGRYSLTRGALVGGAAGGEVAAEDLGRMRWACLLEREGGREGGRGAMRVHRQLPH
jgi:hypothetical protein